MRTMMPAVLLLGLVACPGGSPIGDGGAGDGGSPPDGAPSDGGCPAVTTVLDNVSAWGIQLSGNEIVFVDDAAGPLFYQGSTNHTRALRKVRTDGTGDTVLYTPMQGFQLNDFMLSGSTIYFLESERLMSGSEQTRVYSLPVSGGTPQLIKLHDDPSNGFPGDRADAIVAVDADAAYLVRNILSPASLFRMPLTGGAETIVFKGAIDTRPQLRGTDFYFITSAFPGMTNFDGIGKVAASANMGTPTQVGMAYCRQHLALGDWGFGCAGGQPTSARHVFKYDATGANGVDLFQIVPDNAGGSAYLGPNDGVGLYVAKDHDPAGRAPIYRVPLAGGPAAVVACDRGQIKQRGAYFSSGSWNSAFTNGLDMFLAGSELYWAERRNEAGTVRTAIYKAAK